MHKETLLNIVIQIAAYLYILIIRYYVMFAVNMFILQMQNLGSGKTNVCLLGKKVVCENTAWLDFLIKLKRVFCHKRCWQWLARWTIFEVTHSRHLCVHYFDFYNLTRKCKYGRTWQYGRTNRHHLTLSRHLHVGIPHQVTEYWLHREEKNENTIQKSIS